MKNSMMLYLLLCLASATTYAQQEADIRDVVEIEIPTTLQKTEVQKIKPISKNVKLHPGKKNGTFYQGDGALIKFVAAFGQASDNYLEDIKKGQEAMHKTLDFEPKNYTAVIRSINNYKVLLMSYDEEDITRITMLGISNSGKGVLNASIDYQVGAKRKMEKLVERMLKSIRFKK